MIKKLILPITIAAVALSTACNSSSSEEYEYVSSSSVQVTGFSLKQDTNVLDSLQNVFFSIDLVKGEIFNADSLPYGTKVDKLIPTISTPSTVSAVSLAYPRVGMTDSIVDYLTNSTDSIDFSLGPVSLTVTSESGSVSRTYKIFVNVHTVKPDTLMWHSVQMAALPTDFAAPTAQRAVKWGEKYYCLTTDGTSYCLSSTANPSDPQWSTSTISLPFEANVKTLTATDEKIYMLSAAGELYQSSDFQSWTSTGEQLEAITGVYQDQLLGTKKTADSWYIVSYPSMQTTEAPEGFPVSGASPMLSYDMPMGLGPQTVLVGGRTADGQLSKATWSYDGQYWARVSRSAYELPYGIEEMALVAYDLFDVPSSTWRPVQYPALLLIGGRMDEGAINRTVYISTDWGMTWREGPELLALPEDLPTAYGASSFVYATTLSVSRASAGWTSLPVRSLPPQCTLEMPYSNSRVSAPIDEWECPAIYLIGGYDYYGVPINQMWRGLILRYTFQPKY